MTPFAGTCRHCRESFTWVPKANGYPKWRAFCGEGCFREFRKLRDARRRAARDTQKMRAYQRAYVERHPERRAATCAAYARGPGGARYRRENRDKLAEKQWKRYVQKKLGPSIEPELMDMLRLRREYRRRVDA